MPKQNFRLFQMAWWQWLGLVSVLVVVWYLILWNLDISSAKARDWERREQIKKIGNSLIGGYSVEHAGLPPMNKAWQIQGCQADICPLEVSEARGCNWSSDAPLQDHWRCGQSIYIDPFPRNPDNKQTEGPDSHKYKRIDARTMVLETCLERDDDPEASPLGNSKIGWTMEECPSGAIFQWPEQQVE